jgi:hypothetical protein
MSIDRYMINGVDIKLNLQRNSDAFCLMSDSPPYKVEIMEAVLRVPHIFVSSSLMLAHAKVMETTTAKYPLRKTVIKTDTLTQGSTSYVKDALFEGRIPNRLIIGMVKNTAYSGSYDKNPLLFDHYNINHISVSVNGNPLNAQPLKPSFSSTKTFISNYLSLFKGMGMFRQDGGVSLNRDEYDGGYCLFVFDLTPDPNTIGSSLIKGGNLRMEMQFAEGLPNPVTLIVYGEFSGLLEIDRARSIQLT